MNEEMKNSYEAPRLEVIEVEVEKGFAISHYGNNPDDMDGYPL